jgi:hypothetical protein
MLRTRQEHGSDHHNSLEKRSLVFADLRSKIKDVFAHSGACIKEQRIFSLSLVSLVALVLLLETNSSIATPQVWEQVVAAAAQAQAEFDQRMNPHELTLGELLEGAEVAATMADTVLDYAPFVSSETNRVRKIFPGMTVIAEIESEEVINNRLMKTRKFQKIKVTEIFGDRLLIVNTSTNKEFTYDDARFITGHLLDESGKLFTFSIESVVAVDSSTDLVRLARAEAQYSK